MPNTCSSTWNWSARPFGGYGVLVARAGPRGPSAKKLPSHGRSAQLHCATDFESVNGPDADRWQDRTAPRRCTILSSDRMTGGLTRADRELRPTFAGGEFVGGGSKDTWIDESN